MTKMHLKQPWFTIVLASVYQKQRKNWKVYSDRKHRNLFINELAKAYFQHDMAYGKSKDPAKRTQSKF